MENLNSIKIMGQLSCSGDGRLNKFEVFGESDIAGNLLATDIIVKGSLNVKKNCESGTVNVNGEINVNGLLSGDEVYIEPRDKCYIEEIGGSEVIIKRSKSFFGFKRGKVTSKSIEADKVILQDTECDVVRGENITILSGCSIKKVEYTGTLSVDKSSKVMEEVCQKN
ncbi:MAG: hypothetical protein PUE01_02955 [Clostridiaceae bacterium]|nr:hypothetical protein [Clostridiaceae bacterium]